MKHKLLFLCLIAVFGCKDQPEQIPAYIKLKPFTVSAQGDASWHKITEGWLYVNGEYLGSYTLPATVPILAEGPSTVWLYPGVKANGILATPDIYPLLTSWESSSVNLVAGQTTEIQPTTLYDPAVKFPFGAGRGDFDGGSSIIFENRDNDQTTTYSFTTEGAFAGNCLQMKLDTAHSIIEIATEAIATLPVLGLPEVWLEMHYQCDLPFFLFLLYVNDFGVEASYPVFQFNNAEDMNKIYINLTDSLVKTNGKNYKLFFRAGIPKDNSGKYAQLNGTIRIDNIRLGHL